MTTVSGTLQMVSEEDNPYVGTVKPEDGGVYINTTDVTTHYNHTVSIPDSGDSGYGLSTAVTVSIAVGSAVVIIIIGEYDGGDSGYGLSTAVTVSIAVGSAVVIIIILIVVILFIRRKCKKKSKAWVDNLTLSYIADSNIDLTKDNFDETISLDNDNFLNSLDQNNFSVWTPEGSARQYTYSYF